MQFQVDAGSSDVEGELDIGDRGELAPHAASVLMKVPLRRTQGQVGSPEMREYARQESH